MLISRTLELHTHHNTITLELWKRAKKQQTCTNYPFRKGGRRLKNKPLEQEHQHKTKLSAICNHTSSDVPHSQIKTICIWSWSKAISGLWWVIVPNSKQLNRSWPPTIQHEGDQSHVEIITFSNHALVRTTSVPPFPLPLPWPENTVRRTRLPFMWALIQSEAWGSWSPLLNAITSFTWSYDTQRATLILKLHVRFGTVGIVDDQNSSSKRIGLNSLAVQTLGTANEAKTLAKGAH